MDYNSRIIMNAHGYLSERQNTHECCCGSRFNVCSCMDACLNYFNGKVPRYECDLLRTLYLLRYFCVHKAEIKKLFDVESGEIISYLKIPSHKNINFISIGAGPGIDFAAFLEWLNDVNVGQVRKLNLIGVDVVEGWSNQWKMVTSSYRDLFRKYSARLYRYVGDIVYLTPSSCVKGVSIVCLSYVISELVSALPEGKLEQVLENLVSWILGVVSGRFVLVCNDRPQKEVCRALRQVKDILEKRGSRPVTAREYFFLRENMPSHDIIRISGRSIVRSRWGGSKFRFGNPHPPTRNSENYPSALRRQYRAKSWCHSCQLICFA